MKNHLLAMLLIVQLAVATKTTAQNIAINATGSIPDTSAMLDISSTTKGFLTPRMTTTQQNAIPTPALGLLVFNTTDNVFKVNTGTPTVPIWTPLLFSGSSLTSLNGLTAATQTFATGSSGSNFNIVSGGSLHTLNIPDAATGARGVVTTGTQTFAGDKTFSGKIVAGTLPGGAFSDSLVTTDATGLLKKRTIASVVAGNVWGTFGNSPVNSGNMFFGSVNNSSLRFRSFNIERMVLDSVGNVGFGTTAPKKPIDIVTNLPALGGLMQFRNIADDGYTSIDLQNEAGIQVGNIGWANKFATAYANSFYFATNIAAPMFFATASIERMRILAGGNVGIGVSAPTAVLHLLASTAAAGSASLKIDDGILLTTIEKGTIEKDANVFYLTPDATNRGVLPSMSYSVLSSDYTLTNGTTAQAVFSSGQDIINLPASTTYEFEAQYIITTTGTTNHVTQTLFAGTATLTGVSYIAELSSGAANTQSTVISKTNVNTNAATVLNGNTNSPETVIQLKGIIRTGAGGTLIPQIKFGTAPGGTNKCLANSYFKLAPIGNSTVTKIGSWF